MDEVSVGATLANDIQQNMVWFELGMLITASVLATISAFLAVRAYAMLTDARVLYGRSVEIKRTIDHFHQQGGFGKGAAISDTARRKKTPRRNTMTL